MEIANPVKAYGLQPMSYIPAPVSNLLQSFSFFFNCIPLQLLIGKRALSELENLLVHSKLSHNEMISNNSEGFWPGSFWRS